MGIVDPTEQQLRQYRSQIRRALQVLQKLDRYNCGTKAFRDEIMVPYPDGSWLRFDDVVKAVQILQEGQQ